MDVQKLTYFLTAADLGNFTRAADQCGIAQTTMSKYISQLEEEFGCPLFYRTNKGCRLTEQGQVFYTGAQKLHDEYLSLAAQLRESSDNVLKLGIEGPHLVVEFVQSFRKAHPEVDLQVEFLPQKELLERLQIRHLHAIILPNVIMHDTVKFRIRKMDILKVQDYLILPENAIAQFGSVEEAMRQLPFITKAKDPAYHEYCRTHLDQLYHASFSRIQIAANATEQNMLISLSQGYSVMPMSELLPDTDYMRLPLDEGFREITQLFYRPDQMHPPLRALIAFLRKRGVVKEEYRGEEPNPESE